MHLIRANLPQSKRFAANQSIIQHIKKSTLWTDANSVAIYWAFNHEADITELLTCNKPIYLPAIKNNEMQFQPYNEALQLEKLSYGLKQPKFIEGLTSPAIDLYLIPLLAYDQAGNRLGMGGGYYDRYFAHKDSGKRAGVAYSCQQQDQLPTDIWDVKLHAIFTELGQLKI